MEKKKKEMKTLSEMFVDDFEVQNWILREKSKHKLASKSGIIFPLYTFDFIFCHLIIGKYVTEYQ